MPGGGSGTWQGLSCSAAGDKKTLPNKNLVRWCGGTGEEGRLDFLFFCPRSIFTRTIN